MTSKGFEAIADYYDQKVGEHGDFTHNHLLYPSLLATLGELEGLSVVDLGSGNGASSRMLARNGARVTGIEPSQTLVERAREWERRTPLGIEYVVADATAMPSVPDAVFDHAVANMVLMDVEDAAGLMSEAARVLKPGGRFLATLFHPCFEIPEGSSWLTERIEFDTRISKRIWRYREPFSTPGVVDRGQPVEHTYYHRPLSWYCERLVESGLLIDCLDEPEPDAHWAEESPESYERFMAIPFAITIGARKVVG